MSQNDMAVSEIKRATNIIGWRITDALQVRAQLGKLPKTTTVSPSIEGRLDQAEEEWRNLDALRQQWPERWLRSSTENFTAEQVYRRLGEIIEIVVFLTNKPDSIKLGYGSDLRWLNGVWLWPSA